MAVMVGMSIRVTEIPNTTSSAVANEVEQDPGETEREGEGGAGSGQ